MSLKNRFAMQFDRTTFERYQIIGIKIIKNFLVWGSLFFLLHYLFVFSVFNIPLSEYIKAICTLGKSILSGLKDLIVNLFLFFVTIPTRIIPCEDETINAKSFKTFLVAVDQILKNNVDKEKLFDTTILIGTVTIWITLLTLWRQHVQREQDMALNFPRTYAKDCKFVLNNRLIRAEEYWLFSSYSNMVIELKLTESFPRLYTPMVYRAWVIKRRRGQSVFAKKRKLDILKNDSKYNKSHLFIGMSFEQIEPIIQDYCKRQQREKDYTLELVIDIKWTNNLYPRKKSSIYTRYLIQLEGKGTRNQEDSYSYNISNIRISGAPYFIWKWH